MPEKSITDEFLQRLKDTVDEEIEHTQHHLDALAESVKAGSWVDAALEGLNVLTEMTNKVVVLFEVLTEIGSDEDIEKVAKAFDEGKAMLMASHPKYRQRNARVFVVEL